MESISDWLLHTIREDEKKGIMNDWIEEKRFLILPPMTRIIAHIIAGKSVIVLTDKPRNWFGEYIITNINQPHKGRPFFPIVQVKHLCDMIDAHSDGNAQGFNDIFNMLDMVFGTFCFWYIGKNNIYADFARHRMDGWFWIFDEPNNIGLNSTDEKLDCRLICLFKLFERALLRAMFNKISLDI